MPSPRERAPKAWRVTVRDVSGAVVSTYPCQDVLAALALSAVVRQFWPGLRVSVRRPGLQVVSAPAQRPAVPAQLFPTVSATVALTTCPGRSAFTPAPGVRAESGLRDDQPLTAVGATDIERRALSAVAGSRRW